MGRSESIGEYHGTNNSEILLAKHSLHIWGSKRKNNSTVIPSKNTAKLPALIRSFRQYIIRSLMGLSKEHGLIFSGIKKYLFDQK
jgi:hypothetical protein